MTEGRVRCFVWLAVINDREIHLTIRKCTHPFSLPTGPPLVYLSSLSAERNCSGGHSGICCIPVREMDISQKGQTAAKPVQRPPSSGRKLLIIERKLISNRGHQHTQIAALTSLLPDCETHFIAGDSYDGFLGEAAGKLDNDTIKLSRLRTRMRHGTLSQRIRALVNAIKAGRISLPKSAYGQTLAEACQRLGLGPEDLIVIPTAELDSLESARELCSVLGDVAPQICLRFLSPDLGDIKVRLRERRFQAAIAEMPSKITLFTETEELADFLRNRYGANVTGGFFLPCSMRVGESPQRADSGSETFRVGVFGAPRRGKGNSRIPLIAQEIARLRKSGSGRLIEFVVQGADEDFNDTGVYGSLQEYAAGTSGVLISPHGDRLSPAEFEILFNSVDAILLPYDTTVYGLQGSGIIQDAVAAHKPVIHTEGMSMKSFLSQGNACAASTDGEFAEAILKMAADPVAFAEGAERAAGYFEKLLRMSPLKQFVYR